MKKYNFWVLLVVFIFVSLLSACNNNQSQHDLQYTTHSFDSLNHQLVGRLYKPKHHTAFDPIVIFVHGDGAMDSIAKSFYLPIIESLAAKNIATFSWNKPGVGESQGNWLSQSMKDRATEVQDAIQYLRVAGYQQSQIGLLGFSQASWVFANLHNETQLDFMVLVGGAANWLSQSQYSMWIRLVDEGTISADDLAAIERINQLTAKEYQLIKAGYDHYLAAPLHQDPYMPEPIKDEARFNFVRKNIDADVFEGFSKLNLPMLAIYGDSDVHVDIEHSQVEFAHAFASSSQQYASLEQVTIRNATHGLLRPDLPLDALFSIKKKHFSPSAIETMVEWIDLKRETSEK
ncbi:alpha/beta hydrolase family protein [Pseudoalteromonas obscura]|uniref:Alpha/beta hydrolase n=1 Tax=Pseudoalteromonas obscura TaxID=3048491 RepID=A0ABT7EP76_9GAMM|nr:alpha/beta hydrolase [Pseudoalteromonas sp. P94(2023)]MDK2596850.1 alpha/beta hydrolase [Pseudoalteromonas sp. P94(2023)]